MISIITNLDYSTFERIFNTNVCIYKINPNIFQIDTVLPRGQIIGNIHKNKIWVQLVPERMIFVQQRVFFGKIIQDDKKVIIQGEFLYPIFMKISLAIVALILIGAPMKSVVTRLINGNINFNGLIPELIISIIFALFIVIGLYITDLVNKKGKYKELLIDFMKKTFETKKTQGDGENL